MAVYFLKIQPAGRVCRQALDWAPVQVAAFKRGIQIIARLVMKDIRAGELDRLPDDLPRRYRYEFILEGIHFVCRFTETRTRVAVFIESATPAAPGLPPRGPRPPQPPKGRPDLSSLEVTVAIEGNYWLTTIESGDWDPDVDRDEEATESFCLWLELQARSLIQLRMPIDARSVMDRVWQDVRTFCITNSIKTDGSRVALKALGSQLHALDFAIRSQLFVVATDLIIAGRVQRSLARDACKLNSSKKKNGKSRSGRLGELGFGTGGIRYSKAQIEMCGRMLAHGPRDESGDRNRGFIMRNLKESLSLRVTRKLARKARKDTGKSNSATEGAIMFALNPLLARLRADPTRFLN